MSAAVKIKAGWRQIELNGVTLKVRDTGKKVSAGVPGETFDFWDAFEANQYEPSTAALIRYLCKPGTMFVDVGAWVGPFALLAASLGAHVLAIEPDPDAFTVLRENVDANAAPGPVRLVRLYGGAIVADPWLPMKLDAEEFGQGLSKLTSEHGRPVITTTLPALLETALGPASLVKIDIEGYEQVLAPALVPWLAERKISVQVSLHGDWLDKSLFGAYPTVVWPQHPHGDVIGLPFATMGIPGVTTR